ncbi:MAG: DUF6562 domain-containing protein, partial [Muribaculaceae bacterium]|nr:DUF6562 domain-containing protein [Muribaculaceae bacterium]
ALTGMLFMNSCSDDLVPEPSTGDYVNATFTIGTTEGLGTRAVGDGTTVDMVACAVYDAAGKEITTLRAYEEVNGKTATYSVRLTKGQAYRVAFFAYNAEANAYNVTDLKNVTFNDTRWSNDERRDAFTGYVNVTAEESMNAIDRPVTLYRPFAQLNLGIDNDELAAAKNSAIVVEQTQIKVTNVYSAFSAYDNAVANGATAGEMTFAMNYIPTETLKVTVDGAVKEYKYLALNYLLVGNADDEKSLTDVEFVWKSENEKTNNPTTHFINVPVQRNYRTNIVGRLLTNPADFNIIIKNEFAEDDHIVSVWDGKSVVTPEADANNVYRINSADEFIGMMNDSKYPNCNKYQNVVLECDIDFNGYTISGFGDGSGFFDGVFDGQGHIVSNFKIDATNRTYYAGLFNQVSQYSGENTVIKNLIVKDAEVKGTSQVGVIAGGMNGNTVVENCKVYDSKLSAVKKVGAVVGYTAGGTVKDCYAENCTIEYSEKEAGEVLGFKNTGSTVIGNTFKNITFVASAAALANEMTPVDGVITLNRDYTVSGDWTSLKFSGDITINGNGHKISKLNKPLLAGNAASNLTINNLTITESEIGIATIENGLGTGAFISWFDGNQSVSFYNCHLSRSTVTGNERAAGLIAYSTAKNLVTITDCSVVDCDITAVGGAAGLIAYTATTTNITDSKVTDSAIVSTEDRLGTKTPLAGSIVGTVSADVTFTNVISERNTVSNNNATAVYSEEVGRVVSGSFTDN